MPETELVLGSVNNNAAAAREANVLCTRGIPQSPVLKCRTQPLLGLSFAEPIPLGRRRRRIL